MKNSLRFLFYPPVTHWFADILNQAPCYIHWFDIYFRQTLFFEETSNQATLEKMAVALGVSVKSLFEPMGDEAVEGFIKIRGKIYRSTAGLNWKIY
ncbi:MAG: hypothetical protein J6Q60_06295 [Bacteroidaceae bacterium]|nr:hypothetical protein [Bacteroidaceae bacterium]